MKAVFYCPVLAAALLLSGACTKKEAPAAAESVKVRVSAGLAPSTVVETRGDARVAVPFEDYLFTESNPLKAAVWFSDTKSGGNYLFNIKTGLDYHNTARFISSWPTFLKNDLEYPDGDGEIACVGLYPYNIDSLGDLSTDEFPGSCAWELQADGYTVSHDIDGSSDLMFAPLQVGKRSQMFCTDAEYDIRRLRFTHLLNQVKVLLSIESNQAKADWGDLTELTFKETMSAVRVNLNTGEVSYDTTPQDITAYYNTETPAEMTVTMEQHGWVMLGAPEYNAGDGKYHYTLFVKSTGMSVGKDIDIVLPAPDDGLFVGKMIVVGLRFYERAQVQAVTSLVPMEDESEYLFGTVS